MTPRSLPPCAPAALTWIKWAAPFHDYATYRYGRFACGWKATGQVIASARVLAKLGFSVEKKLRHSGLPGVDIDLYSRTLP